MALRRYLSDRLPKIDDVTVVTPPAEPVAPTPVASEVPTEDTGIAALQQQVSNLRAAALATVEPPRSQPTQQGDPHAEGRQQWARRLLDEYPHAGAYPYLDEMLNTAHTAVLADGHKDGTGEYFAAMNHRVGEQLEALRPPPIDELPKEPTPKAPKPEPTPVQYSAPSSRTARSLAGEPVTRTVTLSPEQLDIARASGVRPEEYAAQLLRMNKMRRAGLIQD